jgi:hypothetical protein
LAEGEVAGNGSVEDYDGPVINALGTIAFVIKDLVGGPVSTAIYQKPVVGALRAIVKEGDSAPGGGAFTYFDDISINKRGDVAFLANYTVDGQEDHMGAFLKPRIGPVTAIIRQGDPLPPRESGITLDSYSLDGPWVNDMGIVAFMADTHRNGGEEAEGLFIKRPLGKVEAFALPGDPSPVGGIITSVKAGQPGMNLSSMVLLVGTEGGQVENFIGTKSLLVGNKWNVLVKQGDAAPAPLTGGIFFNGAPTIDSLGTISFAGETDVPDGDLHTVEAMFTASLGRVKVLAFHDSWKLPGNYYWFGSLEESSSALGHTVFLDEDYYPTGVFMYGY